MILFTYRFELDSANGQILLTTDLRITNHVNVKAANPGIDSARPGAGMHGLAGASAVRSAWFVQQTQIGKYHTRCGSGFTAEDANALHDLWSGRSVEQVGTSNTLNGPDRICAGVAVQTKYCASAAASLKAAFGSDGQYRYAGQVLEVPPEQYSGVIAGMTQAITEGRVEGMTDPGRVVDLVRKGSVSYEQSRRITLPGNRDSLAFDAKLHAANAVLSAGIAVGADLFGSRAQGYVPQHRARQAAAAGAATGAKTLLTGVVTSQFLRTHGARKMTVVMRHGVRAAARTWVGRNAVDAVARVSLGKAVGGAAAVNHCSKLLRSSVIGGAVTLAASTAPNVGRAMVGKMSWGQVGRRGAEDLASTAGGMAGWTVCFTLGSMACGTIMTGGVVLVGAALVGTAGAIAAGEGARHVARKTVDAAVGKEVAQVPSVVVPDWMTALLVAQNASTAERDQVIKTYHQRLRQWCKFDRVRVDFEALEKAKYEVIASLVAQRTEGSSGNPSTSGGPPGTLELGRAEIGGIRRRLKTPGPAIAICV